MADSRKPGLWRRFREDFLSLGVAAKAGFVITVLGTIYGIASCHFSSPSIPPEKIEAIEKKLCLLAEQKQGCDPQNAEALRKALASILESRNKEAIAALQDGDAPRAVTLLLSKGDEQSQAARQAKEDAVKTYLSAGTIAFLYDTHAAKTAYEKALALDPDNVEAWNRLGQVLKRLGDLNAAETAYLKVMDSGHRNQDKELLAVASGNLGILYKTRGELDKAEEYHKKSLALSQELGRKEGMANQYGNLGILYETRGELDKAEEFYKKSLAIETELGRKEGMASDYGNLGGLYKTRGELEKAEEFYTKSLALSQELGRKEGMATQYGNLGGLYQTRGELDKAEEYYKKSLAIDEVLGRKQYMANQYANLGLLSKTRGDMGQACAYWRKSKDLYTQVGMPHKVAKVGGWLAADCQGQ